MAMDNVSTNNFIEQILDTLCNIDLPIILSLNV